MELNFIVLNGKYGVCRLDISSHIPDWIYESEFFTITKTPDELSIVCSQERVPSNIKCERDWRIFRIEGTLDFSMIGILASISNTLSKAEISLFAISTYDTDYILVKDNDFEKAVLALKQEGFGVRTELFIM